VKIIKSLLKDTMAAGEPGFLYKCFCDTIILKLRENTAYEYQKKYPGNFPS